MEHALNNYVYYDPGPGVSNPGPGYNSQPNHAVAIVGWNDSIQTPGGQRPSGSSAIAGATDTQHFGVSYNDFYTGNDTPDQGACNGGAVSFHNVVPNTFQQIYYHNPFGWTAQQPYSYAFNHFTADQNGSLKSVSFYTTDDSVELHGQGLRAVPERRAGAVGRDPLRVGDLRGLPHGRPPSVVPLALGQNFYVELQTSNGEQANDGDISYQQLLDFRGSTTADPPRPLRRAKASSAATGQTGPTFTAWTAPTARTLPSTP